MNQNNTELPEIAVLMATYNGEDFITEQIESILNQQGVYVHLYIKDDGSSDSTTSIIKQYQSKFTNIYSVVTREGLGAAGSFLDLINVVPDRFEFYAFSDQDDIWNNLKLYKLMNALASTDPNIIALAHAGYVLVDKDNSPLPFVGKKFDGRYSLKTSLLDNSAPGFSILFNRTALLASRIPHHEYSNVRMHDLWLFQITSVLGKCVYLDEELTRYRIHSNNTVGVSKNFMKIESYRTIQKNYRMMVRQMDLFFRNFKDQLSNKDLKYIEDYLYFHRNSIMHRLRYVLRNEFYFGTFIKSIHRRLFFLSCNSSKFWTEK